MPALVFNPWEDSRGGPLWSPLPTFSHCLVWQRVQDPPPGSQATPETLRGSCCPPVQSPCSSRVDPPQHTHTPSRFPSHRGWAERGAPLAQFPPFTQWSFPTPLRHWGALSGPAVAPRRPSCFPSRTVDSLYEELVLQGIIKKPPKVQLADYSGQWPYSLPLRIPLPRTPVAGNLGGKQHPPVESSASPTAGSSILTVRPSVVAKSRTCIIWG